MYWAAEELRPQVVLPANNEGMKRLGIAFGITCSHLLNSVVAFEFQEYELSKIGVSESVALSEFEGSVVVFDFFAHWCKPCYKATPAIHEFVESFKKESMNDSALNLEMVAVNVDGSSEARTKRFVERMKLEEAFQDDDGKFFEELGQNEGLPLVVVIDLRKGWSSSSVVYRSVGFPNFKELKAELEDLG